MLNFTVGPVQMDKETLSLLSQQIPYFRTSEFSKILKECEKIFLELVDAPKNSRCAFITGSGTASMEACVSNLFNEEDKLLVVNGGSFGKRFVDLCKTYNLNYTELHLDYACPLTSEELSKYDGKGYTGILIQLCETSTGVLYDMNLIGEFSRKNKAFLLVDGISGFLADSVSMQKESINAFITGSQKALALPPGMSFIILDSIAQERIYRNKKRGLLHSFYFDLESYLINGERGQTPFTPAVGTILLLYNKLKRIIGRGGANTQNKLIAEKARYFRQNIIDLPLSTFTSSTFASNCVTSLVIDNTKTKQKITAYELFEKLEQDYSIWICPNGGELKDKVFRVGHIGAIEKNDIDTLLFALKEILTGGKV